MISPETFPRGRGSCAKTKATKLRRGWREPQTLVILDKRTTRFCEAFPPRCYFQRLEVTDLATAVAPRDGLSIDQLAKGFVCVNQRKAQRIRDMLLGNGNLRGRPTV